MHYLTFLLLLFGMQALPVWAQPSDVPHPLAAAERCGRATLEGARAITARLAGGTSAASAGLDATFYHLDLDVRFQPNYLYGRTRVEGRAGGAPLTSLALDFSSNMQVDSVRALDGTPLSYTHALDRLDVALPDAVAAGAPVALEVFYQGLPVQDLYFGTFVFGTVDGDPYVWTLSEPYGAREWWPSRDHPSDKADSVRVTVTVPAGLRVGSNGLLVDERTNGDGTATYEWFSGYPIATYLVSLAAGRYDVYEQTYDRPDTLAVQMGPLELPLLHYAYEGTAAYEGTSVYSGWKRVVDVLPVLESWFGPYPFPEEKYGHAHVTFGGGMEHQTMSSMGGSDVGLVTHELAHQWFGDLITMRTWPHLWLNEGFATYAELLYWSARADRYPGIYERVFDRYYDRARTVGGTLLVQGRDTASVETLFDGARVYARGGIVLHMLRGVVGDDAFRQILHAYTADPAVRYGTAVTADVQRIAETVSGRDLDAFFRQWVTEGTGHPAYAVSWSSAPGEDRYQVRVRVEQTQEAPQSNVPVFEMPVTLVVETTAGPRRFTVTNDRRIQSYAFDVEAEPTAVLFDPDRLILHNEPAVVLAGDAAPVLPARPALTAVYPNPAAGILHADVALALPGPVRLALYDALGRRAHLVADRALPAGMHTFRTTLPPLPRGTYFLRLETTGHIETHPVTILDFGF